MVISSDKCVGTINTSALTSKTLYSVDAIGRACLARENEAGGSWGQEVHILHVNILYDFVLFLVVIIELLQNSVFQLYFPKDYYKQKQWNTLPVTMIMEIMAIAGSTCLWRS